jgi:hypothetical protein
VRYWFSSSEVLGLLFHVIVANVERHLPLRSHSAGIREVVSQLCSQLHTNCPSAEWYLT